LTHCLGQRLQLHQGAWLAAFVVALDPILLQYTSLPMTETVCTFLVTFWLWHRSSLTSTAIAVDAK